MKTKQELEQEVNVVSLEVYLCKDCQKDHKICPKCVIYVKPLGKFAINNQLYVASYEIKYKQNLTYEDIH